MLKKGTKVQIISKSIGQKNLYFKIGYIIDVRDGNDRNNYGCDYYYSISGRKFALAGDHFLECDFINLDKYSNFFIDKDFEL